MSRETCDPSYPGPGFFVRCGTGRGTGSLAGPSRAPLGSVKGCATGARRRPTSLPACRAFPNFICCSGRLSYDLSGVHRFRRFLDLSLSCAEPKSHWWADPICNLAGFSSWKPTAHSGIVTVLCSFLSLSLFWSQVAVRFYFAGLPEVDRFLRVWRQWSLSV